MDYLGIRLGYLLMMLFWSTASLLHAFSTGAASLLCYRFLLGLEKVAPFRPAPRPWPSGSRAGSAPGRGVHQRKSVDGWHSRTPLTVFVALRFGWRSAFVAIGALGFLWLVAWLPMYRSPREHPRLRKEELDWIESDTVAEAAPAHRSGCGNCCVCPRSGDCWVARLVADPPGSFYMFWLPEYLKRVRGMGLAEIGVLAWIPFLAAAFGGVLGGWGSGYLIRRGTLSRAGPEDHYGGKRRAAAGGTAGRTRSQRRLGSRLGLRGRGGAHGLGQQRADAAFRRPAQFHGGDGGRPVADHRLPGQPGGHAGNRLRDRPLLLLPVFCVAACYTRWPRSSCC